MNSTLIARYLRRWVFLGAAFSGLAYAQVADDAVTVPVYFQGMFNAQGTDPENPATVTITALGIAGPSSPSSGSSEGGDEQGTNGGFARLRPGKNYTFRIDTYAVTRVWVKLTPPAGHRVFINGVDHEMFDWAKSDGSPLEPQGGFEVRLDDGGGSGVGASDTLRPGRLLWSVGLGNLKNGKPAGALRIAEDGLTTNAFKPAALYYDREARHQNGRSLGDEGEVVVVKVNNLLRQVYATTVLADIVPNNDYSYYIRLYPREQVTDPDINSTTLPFNVSGTPLYEFFVENPGHPALDSIRITRTTNQNGQIVMWTQMTKSTPTAGTTVWSVHDWVERTAAATVVSSPVQHRWTYSDGDRNELFEIMDASGTIARSVFKRYDDVNFGVETSRELTYETNGYGGASPVTTSYWYHQNFGGGGWRKVRTISSSDGSWSSFDYYSDFRRHGALQQVRRPHKNDPVSDPGWYTGVGESTTYSYDFVDWWGTQVLPTQIETRIDNKFTSRTQFTYTEETVTDSSSIYNNSAAAQMPVVIVTRKDFFNSWQFHTTVTRTYREDSDPQYKFFRGLPRSVERPDKTMEVMLYFRADFLSSSAPFNVSLTGGARVHATINGTSDGTMGAVFPGYEAAAQAAPANFRVVAGKSTESRTLLGIAGLPVISERRALVGGSWIVTGQDWTTFVNGIWPSLTYQRSSATTTFWTSADNTWTAGRLTATVDAMGVRQTFAHDSVGRVISTTKDGATGAGTTIAAQTVTQGFDAAGGQTSKTTSGGGHTLTWATAYDRAGRVTSESAPGHGTTSYAYDVANRIKTTTLATGSTQVETRYRDGRVLSQGGTAVIAEFYDYLIDTDGRRRIVVTPRSTTDVRRQEEVSDWLGRVAERRRPGFNGATTYIESQTYQPTMGVLTTVSRTGYADTRYDYNGMGEVIRSGLDLSGGGLLPASVDRITDYEQIVEAYDGAYWMTARTWTYHHYNVDAKKLMSVTRERLTGRTPTLRSETRTWDADDNESRTTLTIDAAAKLATSTMIKPGMATAATEVSLNGLSVSTIGHDGLAHRRTYDALGRLQSVIDPRTGTAASYSITYVTNTSLPFQRRDSSNRVVSTTAYDGAGRPTFVQDADFRTARTAYNARGQLEYSWGSAGYPISYGYDTYGQMAFQRTYRDPNNTVANSWEATSWPGAGVVAQETEWQYDDYSGLLKRKYDPTRQYTEYTYNERGQTTTRSWARTVNGSRVTTFYNYFAGSGEPRSITYNDTTPAVNYEASGDPSLDALSRSYTRLGQPVYVTDVTGGRTLTYDATSPWRLATETLSASFYNSRVLANLYEGATSSNTGDSSYTGHTIANVKGRYSGYRLGVSPTASAYELENSHASSDAGRFAGILAKRASGASTRTFVFGYEPSSPLVKSLSVVGNGFQIIRNFEANRDLISRIDALWSGAVRTRYDYSYNDRAQRRTVVQSGDAFADLGTTHQRYTYTTRGELSSAYGYHGSDPESTANPLSTRLHDYDYDAIGNRKHANTSGDPTLRDDYSITNGTNQYNQRENNTLAVSGVAATAAKVAVSGPPPVPAGGRGLAGRPSGGTFWGHNLVVNNQAAPFVGNITSFAALVGAGGGGVDLFRTETKAGWLPPAAQSFTHDADGNLTSDGLWIYDWDAENRLIRMTATAAAVAAGRPNHVLEFRYDYRHRRVKKEVRHAQTGAPISERRFVYDGWNVIAETDATHAIKRSFTWGLDVTGGTLTAGGVGALLQIHDYDLNKTLFPAYDGNGNIAALVNAADGVVEASYEYSPFGEVLRATGAYAAANPFRFSTKWQDDESGLLYYGYRYYSARDGRFINRDLIEEAGGVNLYGFCGNDGVNRWDYLGQKSFLSKFWSKFRHTIISAVLSAIPGVGSTLSIMYNTGVGARYGGIKGAILALASGGKLGRPAHFLASYYGLYQQFGRGNFLENLGNFLTGRLVSNTAYQWADAVFNGGPKPIVRKMAEQEEPADTTGKTKITSLKGDNGNTQLYLKILNIQENKWETYLTDRIDTKYVYLNGITGDLNAHFSLAEAHLDRRFDGITQYTLMNNVTHGPGMDILEAGLDIIGISSHPARVFTRKLEDALARGMKPTVIGHSQGGAILTQALRILQAKGVDASGLTVIYHAAASNSQYARSLSRSIGAAFGGHAYSPGDLIGSVVGMNSSITQVLPALFNVPKLFGERHISPHSAPDAAVKFPWSVFYPAGP